MKIDGIFSEYLLKKAISSRCSASCSCQTIISGIWTSAYVTTSCPVIVVGWMSHLKKYVPGFEGAVNVYVIFSGPVMTWPTNILSVAAVVV